MGAQKGGDEHHAHGLTCWLELVCGSLRAGVGWRCSAAHCVLLWCLCAVVLLICTDGR